MSLGLAKSHELTVVTRANNREKIESDLKGYSGPVPRFVYVDPASWVLRLKKRGLLPVQIFYQLWQIEVSKVLRKSKEEFEIVHQLTFNSFEVPPLAFWRLKGLKIWGPMGGGQTVPRALLSAFGKKGALKEALRNLRVRISSWNPLCRGTLRRSALVLFANRETQQLLGQNCKGKTDSMIDVGVDIAKFTPKVHAHSSDQVVFLFAGRLEGRKGVLLLIRAFAEHAREVPNTELRIVGSGPLADQVKEEVDRMTCSPRVVLTGLVSHTEMENEFARADVFVFPSLRDTSGAAVLEAMAMELPVICFDHQGSAMMVSDACGLKVPADSTHEAIRNLGQAMNDLAGNRERRLALGKAGRVRVAGEYDWESKVSRINRYYQGLGSSDSSDEHDLDASH
ncbi:glycosyltransferase family 4 protein [Verrucomicrobiaceae bacterium 227]